MKIFLYQFCEYLYILNGFLLVYFYFYLFVFFKFYYSNILLF